MPGCRSQQLAQRLLRANLMARYELTMLKGNFHGRLASMARRLLVGALLLIGVGDLCSALAAEARRFRADRIIIVPKAGRAADAHQIHANHGRRVKHRFEAIQNLEVVELAPGEDPQEAAAEYQASGAVEVAEPDYILTKSVSPNDPQIGYQWHLGQSAADHDIDAPEGWDIRHDATNIIVAIIDTGARLTHQDLAPNLWVNTREIPGNGIDDDGDGYIDDVHGINAITGSGNPTDDDGHGTHVAGIIGGAGNNGVGISGVAWKVQLMPLKFMGADGSGYTTDAIECMNYAIKMGAKVINASFGSSSYSGSMQTAMNSARNAGIVFVAAAGNESANNDTTPSYPANYSGDNLVSVAATTSNDQFETLYSNYGATTVDIAAPGTQIYSCGYSADDSYVYMSGTSMATSVVSGVVALMRAQFPSDTAAQIVQRLLAAADPLPSLAGKCVSGGRVNLQKALSPYVNAGFTPSTLAASFPATIRFTNQSVGEISGYLWNFGDGSATSTETNPSHVYASEGSYTVTLTVSGAGNVTSTKSQTVAVLPGYTYKSVAYEWIDPTAMTRLPLSDNGSSSAITLPFAFYFYGQPKTQIYVGANGLIGFDSTTSFSATANSDIPTAASPNGAIYPYWDNLNPSTTGAVYYGVTGAAPNRRFVLSWVGVPRVSTAIYMTFQAELFETTGQIQFNYLEVNPTSSRGGGARATIGVEDPSGLVATKYCFDGTPNRAANGQSILFNQNISGGLTVSPDSVPTFSGIPAALQTNIVDFTLKNTSRLPLIWSAGKTASWTSLTATNGILGAGEKTTVSVLFTGEVATLAPGSHSEVVSFVNANNGSGNTQRTVTLEVNAIAVATRINPPVFANGVFQLEIPGSVGETFIIEASRDLLDWQEIQRGVVGPSGAMPFTDTAPTTGSRFFRVLVL